jgi:hypothetical protein
MARDVFVLGTVGSGSEILLPGVLEFSEETNIRVDAGSFEQNKRGGYAIPREFGIAKISLECIHYVDNPSEDALDVSFGELKSAIMQKLRRGPQPLWLMDDWYANVVLDNNAFSERERTDYSVRYGLNLLCKEGRKLYKDEETLEVNNGVPETIISPTIPPIFIEFTTSIGQSYTIQNNYSSGLIKINATASGIIRIHLEENRATRNGIYVDSEIEGAFPDFPCNQSFVASMTNINAVNFKFRKALLL